MTTRRAFLRVVTVAGGRAGVERVRSASTDGISRNRTNRAGRDDLRADATAGACIRRAVAPTAPDRTGRQGLAYPGYIPFQGPKPDLEGTPEGVSDAYFSYPTNLVKSVPVPPGHGEDVTLFASAIFTPAALDQNPRLATAQ